MPPYAIFSLSDPPPRFHAELAFWLHRGDVSDAYNTITQQDTGLVHGVIVRSFLFSRR